MAREKHFNSDVACVGEVMLESIIPVAEQPPPNSTVVFRDDTPPLGGAVINVAWYLSALGKFVRLVTPVGRRDVKSLRDMFQGRQIDLNDLIITAGHSDHLFTTLSPGSHRSLYRLGAVPPNLREEVIARSKSGRLLILNGGRHQEMRAAFMNLTHESQARWIAFNPAYAIYEYFLPELEKIMRGVDVFIVNQEEYAYLKSSMPSSRRPETLPRLAFILTKGKKGVELFSQGRRSQFDSLTDREGTYLGGGDALLAGFLSRLIGGYGPEQAMALGLKLAALVVEQNEIRAQVPQTVLAEEEKYLLAPAVAQKEITPDFVGVGPTGWQ